MSKRRAVDSEINLIPMIDLLICTVSFLLITAVWSQMARVNADAQVPGPPDPDKEVEDKPVDKMLHVEMRGEEKFTLLWKQGATVVNTIDVPRKPVAVGQDVRYPDLATKISEEWKMNGSHRDPSDKKLDQAVLHTDNNTPFKDVIAVIDAIYEPKRELSGANEPVPAFNVTFAVN